MGCSGSKERAIESQLLPPPSTIQHWIIGLDFPFLRGSAADEAVEWFLAAVSATGVSQDVTDVNAALLNSAHFLADMQRLGLCDRVQHELARKAALVSQETAHVRRECERILRMLAGALPAASFADVGNAAVDTAQQRQPSPHGALANTPTRKDTPTRTDGAPSTGLWRNIAWGKESAPSTAKQQQRRTKRYRSGIFSAGRLKGLLAPATNDDAWRGSQNSLTGLLGGGSSGSGTSPNYQSTLDTTPAQASAGYTAAAAAAPSHKGSFRNMSKGKKKARPVLDDDDSGDDGSDDGGASDASLDLPLGPARPAGESEAIVAACGRRRESIDRVARHWKITLEEAIDLMATVEVAQNGGADVKLALKNHAREERRQEHALAQAARATAAAEAAFCSAAEPPTTPTGTSPEHGDHGGHGGRPGSASSPVPRAASPLSRKDRPTQRRRRRRRAKTTSPDSDVEAHTIAVTRVPSLPALAAPARTSSLSPTTRGRARAAAVVTCQLPPSPHRQSPGRQPHRGSPLKSPQTRRKHGTPTGTPPESPHAARSQPASARGAHTPRALFADSTRQPFRESNLPALSQQLLHSH